jgi:hypothetical protein
VPRVSKEWIPLYIYYEKASKTMFVTVSSYSMYSSDRPDYNEDEIVAAAKKHPGFKGYTIKGGY